MPPKVACTAWKGTGACQAPQACWALGRRQGAESHLLLCSERLLRSQDDQQLLQGSALDGLHLDLWVAMEGGKGKHRKT